MSLDKQFSTVAALLVLLAVNSARASSTASRVFPINHYASPINPSNEPQASNNAEDRADYTAADMAHSPPYIPSMPSYAGHFNMFHQHHYRHINPMLDHSDKIDSFWQQFERKFNAPGGLFDKAKETNNHSNSHSTQQSPHQPEQDYVPHSDEPQSDERAASYPVDAAKLNYDARNPVYVGQESRQTDREAQSVTAAQAHSSNNNNPDTRQQLEQHHKLLEQHKQRVMQRLAQTSMYAPLSSDNHHYGHQYGHHYGNQHRPHDYHDTYHTHSHRDYRYGSPNAEPTDIANTEVQLTSSDGFRLAPASDSERRSSRDIGDPNMALHESRPVLNLQVPVVYRMMPPAFNLGTYNREMLSPVNNNNEIARNNFVNNDADSGPQVRSQRRRKDLSSSTNTAYNNNNNNNRRFGPTNDSNNVFKFYAYEKVNNYPPRIESFIRNPFV